MQTTCSLYWDASGEPLRPPPPYFSPAFLERPTRTQTNRTRKQQNNTEATNKQASKQTNNILLFAAATTTATITITITITIYYYYYYHYYYYWNIFCSLLRGLFPTPLQLSAGYCCREPVPSGLPKALLFGRITSCNICTERTT